jgi:SAM-dependent methyltransferase
MKDLDLEVCGWGSSVGEESRKTWNDKVKSGFWNKYASGTGLDIGYAGYKVNVTSILPSAIGVDTNYPGYNGLTLPFADASQDYVYNSHCLEHISDYKTILRDWYRVLKPGGFMIIIVPHRDLYEKRLNLPSRYNQDHKRFYTPNSLLSEVEESLAVNTYRVRHLQDNDRGHDYKQDPDMHSIGEYEIELVIQKL